MNSQVKKSQPIYTLDIETDPFLEGRYPRPFAIDLYDGESHHVIWSENCIEEMRAYVNTLPEGIIYAHNGGRFDIFYLMDWVCDNPMRVINGRIIEATMRTPDERRHLLRDSYAIMPFALGSYKGAKRKLDIDITKLERENRETNKAEIVEYLEMDTEVLWELCTAFHKKFGNRLTIGSTAMKELQKFHQFKVLPSSWDWYIRGGEKTDGSQHHGFYYGGRVECFASGLVEGAFKVYDINSSYPYSMLTFNHPTGSVSSVGREITSKTCFVKVRGINRGAFPMRVKGGGIVFDIKRGVFTVSIHEYRMAIKYDLFTPKEIIQTIDFEEQSTFADFVDTYYKARLASKALNDAVNEMFYKIILNSSYGKFSQNPDKYEENMVCRAGWERCPGERCTCLKDKCECGGWTVKAMSLLHENDALNFWVWRCNSKDVSRYNVATGASITGASRALLMEAIHLGQRVVYCDTDSVICESLSIATGDAKKLGAWKLEAEGTSLAIGGKKLYALLDGDSTRNDARLIGARRDEAKGHYVTPEGKKIEYLQNKGIELLCIKKANKGVVVTAQEILDIANGATITSRRDAPSFKLDGSVRYIKRDVRLTA